MNIAIAGVITKPITKYALGGTEVFTYLLIKGLVQLGHEVTLYCAQGSDTPAQHHIQICNSQEAMGSESNVEFVYPYTLLQIRRILEDIPKSKYDILHVNFLKTFMMSYFAENISIPVIHTIHRDFMQNKRLYDVYDRIGFHSNEHFVFVSEAAKLKSLLKNHSYVIHNGIDIDDYPFAENLNQSNYLWLSRIDPLKGPREAILSAQNAGVKLILSGERDREKYEKYFSSEIVPLLSDTIVYEPPSSQERKIKLYQNAKALVFPIQWEEPFGLVVAEALACGTPVITFDRGAMSELVEDAVTGYVVPQKDGVEGIARAIKKIQALPESDYSMMRRQCRTSVEKNFSYTLTAQEYEKLYHQVSNKPIL